jgi:lysophospholipase L1-like esterase
VAWPFGEMAPGSLMPNEYVFRKWIAVRSALLEARISSILRTVFVFLGMADCPIAFIPVRAYEDYRSMGPDVSAISSRLSALRGFVFLFLLAFFVVGTMPAEAVEAQRADLAAPKRTKDGQLASGWIRTHESFVAIAKKGEAGVVFLGDSLTAHWRTKYPTHFAQEFGKYNAVNFGIAGDKTQNVLWRVQNGTLAGLKPKVVVLMVGTNNAVVSANPPEQIAAGINKIINAIHKRSASTNVLLLSILPRGAAEADAKNSQVNALIAGFHDGRRIHYLNIRRHFLNSDGKVSRALMPDLLHLNEKGYKVWADAIRWKLASLAR